MFSFLLLQFWKNKNCSSVMNLRWFGIVFQIVFLKNNFFIKSFFIFFIFYCFNELISKIIFLNKKNIILMHFWAKSILKNNRYYIFKHPLKQLLWNFIVNEEEPNLAVESQMKRPFWYTVQLVFLKILNFFCLKLILFLCFWIVLMRWYQK